LATLSNFSGKEGGRSGAFIYNTYDRRFVIKTITADEKLLLLNKLLPDYLTRVYSKDTCLVRILGVYMLQCIGNYSTNLMVMEQVGPGLRNNLRYDIKGSSVNRRMLHNHDLLLQNSIILKDNDFEELVGTLNLEVSEKARLVSAVRADSAMLASHGIMDYSLLIQNIPMFTDFRLIGKYAYSLADNDDAVVLIAMIDILQEYTFSKKIEGYWKRMSRCRRSTEVSSIDPKKYAIRIVEFCEGVSI
jgi:hypothetical protein